MFLSFISCEDKNLYHIFLILLVYKVSLHSLIPLKNPTKVLVKIINSYSTLNFNFSHLVSQNNISINFQKIDIYFENEYLFFNLSLNNFIMHVE